MSARAQGEFALLQYESASFAGMQALRGVSGIVCARPPVSAALEETGYISYTEAAARTCT